MGSSKEEIIKKRIEKLTQEDFDLEAWKETTFAVLSKIIDRDDSRLDQIRQLKVDYGSWALRDATSRYNPVETAKKKGKEVLESVIDELENENILSVTKEYLSSSSFENIAMAETLEELQKILSKEKKTDLTAIISQIILKER
jgi:hypothetical protein